MEKIEHFDHKHPLSLSNRMRGDRILCKACYEYCDGQTYICSRTFCEYGLHESCAKLPREVQSPFHRPHSLTLQAPTSPFTERFLCHGCNREWKGFRYGCGTNCNFQLDTKCGLMRTVKEKEEEEQGQLHTNHLHPFLLYDKVPSNRYGCAVCGKYCSSPDPTYGCLSCRLFLHPSCFERNLPRQIQHFSHPHPLTLSTTLYIYHQQTFCKACLEGVRNIWYYSCWQCKDFVMDINCALIVLPTTVSIDNIKSESLILHSSHGHPLSLYNGAEEEKECNACHESCTNPTYACYYDTAFQYCERYIYFHKLCIDFDKSCLDFDYPQQICHPFHPYHPLRLTLQCWTIPNKKCNACRKSSLEFYFKKQGGHIINYICEAGCDFFMHPECGVNNLMMPAITYQGHAHLLQFRDDNIENYKLQCSACKCNISESYAFNCLYCDLNLHLHCGPVPYTIKHEDHIHPLFPTSSPVQEEVEDETDEFYCHACEEERNPQLPVYYCEECQFIAEFKCIFSQIILLLKGEYGDIELRSTFGHHGMLISANTAKEMCQNNFEQVKQTSTVSHISESSRKDVIEELSDIYMATKTITTEEDGHYKDSEYSEDFLLSDQAYTQFMKFLDSGKVILKPWDTSEEAVNVRDYMVPPRLAPILMHMLSKHGDFSTNSTLSPMAKLYLFNIFCECIYNMTNTNVVDITKDLLLDWWTSFKMLRSARFEIQFAFDHLKRLTDAYFGLYVKKRVDNALDNIDRDLAKLYKEIEGLEKKRECIKSAKSEKSSIIEKCFKEGLIMKHRKASTGLLKFSP